MTPEQARRRLPGWVDRLLVGDAADWSPPRRRDVVRTKPVHVDGPARPAFLRRLPADVDGTVRTAVAVLDHR